MKKFLHAVAALLTVALFLLRRHCVMARGCQPKRSSFEPLYPQGSRKSMRPPDQECRFCARQAAASTTCAAMPKYKRDPDIQIDDEHIGVYPRV